MKFNETDRIEHDLKQAKELALHLDKECGFNEDLGAVAINKWLESKTTEMEKVAFFSCVHLMC